jgi:hypothetical protein
MLRRYLGDGQYDFFWTANTAGQYEVDVRHQGMSLATAPYSVTVGPGLVYPINCVADGAGLKESVAGEMAMFNIISRDKYGNNRTSGELCVCWCAPVCMYAYVCMYVCINMEITGLVVSCGVCGCAPV